MNKPIVAMMSMVMLAIFSVSNLWAADSKKGEETKSVKVGGLTLILPSTWKQVEPKSRLRLAQFELDAAEGEKEKGECAVFSFGASGIEDNVRRWMGQFAEKGRTVNLTTGKCDQGVYFWCELHGTYNKPDGPPFAMKTVPVKNSRVINVALVGADKKLYFFKVVGLDKTSASHADALRRSFGGDKAKEKKYELK